MTREALVRNVEKRSGHRRRMAVTAELAADGLAVILVTSELPEAMGLADRLIVMHEGRVVGRFTRGEWSAERIVAAATGSVLRDWAA